MEQRTWASERRLTAISRASLSVPARQALIDRQVSPGRTVLDYGCGRGGDVRALRQLDCHVTGWDPFYQPDTVLQPADVVLLTYVLNVIEDPRERRKTLKAAWDLAGTILIASVRLTWEKSKVRGEAFGDGLLTSRQTFQHLFGASELRNYVQEVTGVRTVSATPGVVYAFKDETARLSYLARRIIPDEEWLASEDTASAIAAIVDHAERRGRLPRMEEVPQPMAELLRHLHPNELRRLVRDSADQAKVEGGGKQSTLNTLLFLAVELFNGRGPFSSLPLSLQLDVRAFFTSYKEACQRADRLLLKLRDDTYIRGAMNASAVGKLTPTALYVHRRAVDRMPTVLRLYEHCASIAAGRPPEWTVTKLRHRGRAVSWLNYPDFDKDPHPRIRSSYQVDLQSLETSHTSYADSVNRPLLHRKHEFLAPDDPDVDRYKRLTASEVRAGLYESPHLIGTENGWETELIRCGRQLRGHRLVRRTSS
ncbi:MULTISPECIES: DNA phosphorothioation-associated putative methyltransferase [unclassified Streptomyces]|uniref:DNA phosphorothioation-associated putative methyltransferase n=1 Tax=unclassified Streptomyces TaxID=2593676 RepID=UPI0003A06DE3|nr:DNA phosphorothioation-associated putative methyltransferase [Streptomyces sp. LaPpAH-202]MYW59407.1 DNA phosphorothioation-associated putative methyltransferase [Streptomyces sp. SID8370]MYW84115.1 DNA phosphorothioation-associated putative methyltransferase [Streptomyces sp. SID8371]